ncbi:acyl-CoA dehydrogenase family protein [Alteromonas sp. RKMC-009]|uniref:acyl-CoA dehydrogenase family protein n=1 Tax=Alteromonas sp. RKMC-009 TaxID=2267264 RepID=UPI000E67B532|nr:acyl-CoA dehydrogenase family protein [Alteromonas sp. RKMC-009]AYA63392.1 flavin-dependent monooxygenase [Alteromonas sp. RKMC-009]
MWEIDRSLWGSEDELDQILTEIRSRANEFEEQRFISQDIIDGLKKIGVYRAFVPKKFGGLEVSPIDFLLLIEEIAKSDGSTGWVASFGMNPAYLAALPEHTAQQIWKDSPDIVFAGGIFPATPSSEENGLYTVNGRWKFASGCMSADYLGVGIKPSNDEKLPRMAVLRPGQVKIEKTWDVHGMAGTGSFDLVVENQHVAHDWTFVRGGMPTIKSPFFTYPSLALAAQVLSVNQLGLAREALNIIRKVGSRNKTVTGAPSIGDREYAQIDIAKAEAKVLAARAFFYNATHELWTHILKTGESDDNLTNAVRLATTNVARECASAIQTVYRILGMAGIYRDQTMSRIFRDSQVITQHAFMGEFTYQNAGRMFFGSNPFPGYL